MRLLIIKTSSLGDVVHNLPVIADIVAHFPEAVIDWVVEERFAEIPALHPRVNRVVPVALRRWRRRVFNPTTWRDCSRFRKDLQSVSYDHVIDTQGLIKSAWLARLAYGPVSGQDRHSARERLASFFYQRRFPVPRGRHAVVRNRDLVAQALGYPLPDGPPDYGIQPPSAKFSFTVPSSFLLALHATSRSSKRWPATHWVTLGKALEARGIHLLLPWGSESEEQEAYAIAAELRNAIVLPRMRLRDLAALMGQARAVVGVDTGLVHLAAALNRPTVGLYTDTSPLLTGVLASSTGKVSNLGDRHQIPEPHAVFETLSEFGVLPA